MIYYSVELYIIFFNFCLIFSELLNSKTSSGGKGKNPPLRSLLSFLLKTLLSPENSRYIFLNQNSLSSVNFSIKFFLLS